MTRFTRWLPWGLVILFCSVFAGKARADVFALVPGSSPLYAQLKTVQDASWENDFGSHENNASKGHGNELTRYEFAIEIAKSAIDFTAHRQANPQWLATVPRIELRALRALVLAFTPELTEFNVHSQDIANSIDDILRSPAAASTPSEASLLLNKGDTPSTLEDFSFPSSVVLPQNQAANEVNLSLSQKFQLYAQLSDLSASSANLLHPTASTQSTSGPALPLSETDNTALSAGANMDINDWLSLRAGYAYNQNNQPLTLQQTLQANNTWWFPSNGSNNSIGGGVDVKVSPGLTLSGGISRLMYNASGLQNDFSATQLEGGVGVSGMSNRLLLSAQLARLMPDDTTSLASTAARLNLDFAVSNTLSLNLLYQQMFSLSSQSEGKSTLAGGVNIHF